MLIYLLVENKAFGKRNNAMGTGWWFYLNLFLGLTEATNAIASKFGGSNAKDKLAESFTSR